MQTTTTIFVKLRSFTLPCLTPKGPSIGVLLLGKFIHAMVVYKTNPMQSYLSGLCAIVSNCQQTFTTRSFFLAPVEQSHVNRVVEKLGGPELQARQFLQISGVFGRHRFFLYIKTACVAMQVSKTKRKSLTISWGKHGGLRKSFGSQLHFPHDQN